MLVTGAKSPDNPFEVMKKLAGGGSIPATKDTALSVKKTTQKLYNKTMKHAMGMSYQLKQMEGDKVD